jgi:hypothetical protein
MTHQVLLAIRQAHVTQDLVGAIEMKDLFDFICIAVVATVLAIAAIEYLKGNDTSCKEYGELYKKEVYKVQGGGCYVRTEDSWIKVFP